MCIFPSRQSTFRGHRLTCSHLPRQVTQTAKPNGMIALSNGCICCTLRKDLLRELIRMAVQGNIDCIVIEGSGITEPQPLVEMFADAANPPSDGQISRNYSRA
jgi:G3E family GTPase